MILAISGDDVPEEERPIVLLSSHIMQEVSAVCDEILIIAHGRLIVMDTPENLIADHRGFQRSVRTFRRFVHKGILRKLL